MEQLPDDSPAPDRSGSGFNAVLVDPPRTVIPGFRQTVREFMASKTNWTGLTMAGAAGVAYLTGEVTASAALTSGLTGLSLLFIRDAIAGTGGSQ